MNDSKVILGIIGEIGSGKDTVTAYITKNYPSGYIRYSKILRDILDLLSLPLDREHYATLAQALRDTFGEDMLSRAVYEQMQEVDATVVVADGIRREGELSYFKQFPAFHALFIETDIHKRYERILERNQKADDTTKTFEEFRADHERTADKQVKDLKVHADFVINNDGALEDLYRQIDRLMMKFNIPKVEED